MVPGHPRHTSCAARVEFFGHGARRAHDETVTVRAEFVSLFSCRWQTGQ